MASHLYEGIWGRTLPQISKQLKKGPDISTIQLSKDEFEAAGNRRKSGYAINLEINGENIVKIKKSAVARDLARIALNDFSFKKLAAGKYIKLRMDKSFLVHLKVE